jgi:hypothetical protein
MYTSDRDNPDEIIHELREEIDEQWVWIMLNYFLYIL